MNFESGFDLHLQKPAMEPTLAKKITLLAGLEFGRFVLFYGDRQCLVASGARSGVNVIEREPFAHNKAYEIIVGGKVAGSAIAPCLKEAKKLAFVAAMKKLQEECYTIKPRPDPDRIYIRKDNQTIICNLKTTETEEKNKIDQNNIGYKMMQKLGWSGGGLGAKSTGRENPVDYLIRQNRKGLGNTSSDVNRNYFKQMLENYIKSDDIKDLYFEASFTKEERASLHQIASEKDLKSTSHGKEPNRQLVITKKTITPTKIIEEILLNKNPMYMNKYEVKVPKKMINQFPDNAQFEVEEE